MFAASYNGCLTTGHETAPPTTITATQSVVFINGVAALVEGDKIVPHAGHEGSVIGTSNVFINGKRMIHIGDSVTCGDHVAQGSPTVFIG